MIVIATVKKFIKYKRQREVNLQPSIKINFYLLIGRTDNNMDTVIETQIDKSLKKYEYVTHQVQDIELTKERTIKLSTIESQKIIFSTRHNSSRNELLSDAKRLGVGGGSVNFIHPNQ